MSVKQILNSQPTISAIVPVYNHAEYLSYALDSILQQTRPVDEIIVVDDGSTDNSAELAHAFAEVEVLQTPHLGIGHARNFGIARAHGDYVSFLDADDLWAEGKTEQQAGLLQETAQLDMVFGMVKQFVSPDSTRGASVEFDDSLPGLVPGAMMVRASSLARVGSFDEEIRMGEFIDWYARARHIGLFESRTDNVVCMRRIHDNNQGIRERDSRRDYLEILKRNLDRKRQDSR